MSSKSFTAGAWKKNVGVSSRRGTGTHLRRVPRQVLRSPGTDLATPMTDDRRLKPPGRPDGTPCVGGPGTPRGPPTFGGSPLRRESPPDDFGCAGGAATAAP